MTGDAHLLPVLMATCGIAAFVAEHVVCSFDHGMMYLSGLPFLDEAPPKELEVLTARDVMASPVASLYEISTVSDVVGVLRTSHNGFPILEAPVGPRNGNGAGGHVLGLILRRQLLALLHGRVWELPEGETPPPALRIRFLTSFVNMDQLEADVATLCLEQADLKANVDLRPYIDAAPFMATTLMPLPRVYRLFNQARAAARADAPPFPISRTVDASQIGVRHVPVLNRRKELVGVITRKDLLTETIQTKLSAQAYRSWAMNQAPAPSAAQPPRTPQDDARRRSVAHAGAEAAAELLAVQHAGARLVALARRPRQHADAQRRRANAAERGVC